MTKNCLEHPRFGIWCIFPSQFIEESSEATLGSDILDCDNTYHFEASKPKWVNSDVIWYGGNSLRL